MNSEIEPMPDPPAGQSRGEETIETLVASFIALHEEGEQVAPDVYVTDVPIELRDEVIAHCESYLEARAVLGESSQGSSSRARVDRERLGEFRLVREIGRGGMGVVYLARQDSLDRLVALKVLPAHLARTDVQVKRFLREWRKAGSLRHPGIVPVYSVGETDGHHYYAMEYVEGGTLGDEIARRRELGRHFEDVSYPARIAMRLAEALHCSHEAGVIHRDVKPQNVLLDVDEQPRLVDFGLAFDPDDETLTRSGEVAGTYHYMSPEQASGDRDLTPATDVYSLCVVLYEMLTLERPIDADSPSRLMARIPLEEPRSLMSRNPRIPKDLDTICRKGLAKSPVHRYANAAALAEDLGRFIRHEAIHARPPSSIERAARFVRVRRRALTAAAFFLAFVVLGTGAVAKHMREQARLDRFLTQTERRLADRESIARSILERSPETDAEAEPDKEDVSLSRVVGSRARRSPSAGELRDLATRLRSIRIEVDDDQRRQVDGWLNDIRWIGEHLKQAGSGLVDRGNGMPPVPAGEVPPAEELYERSSRDLERGALVLRQALLVLGEDPEIERALRHVGMSIVTFRSTPDTHGASIAARRVDRLSGRLGEEVALGVLPLDDVGLEPGLYRFIARRDGDLAEFHVDLPRWGARRTVDVILRDSEVVRQGMVPVEGGRFEATIEANRHLHEDLRLPRVVTIDGFRMDRAPVSNAEYERYLLDTGADAPRYWLEQDDRHAGWDEQPVVGVRLEDARHYAAWAGKRLPTAAEWEWAMRGPAGERFPWGSDASRLDQVVPQAYGQRYQNDEQIARLLRERLPASAAATPGHRGFERVFGSVWEWTETVRVEWVADVVRPDPSTHHLRGGSWFSLSRTELAEHGVAMSAFSLATIGQFDYGFRCVISDDL